MTSDGGGPMSSAGGTISSSAGCTTSLSAGDTTSLSAGGTTPLSAVGNTSSFAGGNISSPVGGNISSSAGGTPLRYFLPFLLCFKTFRAPSSPPVVSAGASFDPVISHGCGVSECSDASHLTEGDAGRPVEPALGFGEDGDGSCEAGMGVGVGGGAGAGDRRRDCTCGMDMSASLLFGLVVGLDRRAIFAFVDTLSRRSCIDLPKINRMIAVRCGLSPDEEPRITLGSKVGSTKGFNLDWKSSCSISLMRS